MANTMMSDKRTRNACVGEGSMRVCVRERGRGVSEAVVGERCGERRGGRQARQARARETHPPYTTGPVELQIDETNVLR